MGQKEQLDWNRPLNRCLFFCENVTDNSPNRIVLVELVTQDSKGESSISYEGEGFWSVVCPAQSFYHIFPYPEVIKIPLYWEYAE